MRDTDLGNPELSFEMLKQSIAAWVSTREELETCELTDSSNAARLGLSFLAYFAESALHLGDSSGGEWSYETIRGVKLEYELALADAQAGDYRRAKEKLTWTKNLFLGRKDFSEALAKIVELMPDHDEPFVMPLPAWMDPRFNGEQDQGLENPQDRVQ